MIAFQVNDMTCGHCVSMITKAVTAVDQGAKLNFDLGNHEVRIEPVSAGAQTLSAAIKDAGYTPVALAAGATSTSTQAPRSGCCCG